MKKDFSKKSYRNKSKSPSSRGRWYGVTFIIIVLMGGAGFWFYQHKKPSFLSPVISNYATRTQEWMTERKNRLQENLKKVKRVAVSEDDPPPIHFEFYTALPSMQMNDSIQKKVEQDIVASEEKALASKKIPTKKMALHPSIFDADKLQQALNEELNPPRYSGNQKERIK